MRLFEFADAKASLELWKLVNDCVWKAISVQAQEQERRDNEQALKQKKNPKSSVKVKQPRKPSIPSSQPSKTKKTSAQEIQSKKVQSKTPRSNPQTVLSRSSSVANVGAQNALKTRSQMRPPQDPNSVASIQKKLDPLAFDPIVAKFTS
jgi:hypothetical protein